MVSLQDFNVQFLEGSGVGGGGSGGDEEVDPRFQISGAGVI